MGKQVNSTAIMAPSSQTPSALAQPALRDAINAKVSNQYFAVATASAVPARALPVSARAMGAKNVKTPAMAKVQARRSVTLRASADTYDPMDCMPSDCNTDVPFTESSFRMHALETLRTSPQEHQQATSHVSAPEQAPK